ncbi:hypothetical protein ROS1_19410 [Roseibium sp. ROS1]
MSNPKRDFKNGRKKSDKRDIPDPHKTCSQAIAYTDPPTQNHTTETSGQHQKKTVHKLAAFSPW